jgi:acetyl-CoA acetyltransferase
VSTHAAVVGMGHTEMSLRPGGHAAGLAGEAVSAALQDAGLHRSDVDGLLVASSQGVRPDRVGVQLARDDGFGDLRLLEHVEIKGASAVAMVQRAALAIDAGLAETVVCVFADAPLQPGGSTGSTYAQSGGNDGVRGLERASGLLGSVPTYALMAARYLSLTGGSEADLCAVVRTGRMWAAGNPAAVQRTPLSCEDYFNSRMISTPLRVLDCARPVNGGAAIVLSKHRPNHGRTVEILGMAQRHPMRRRRAGAESWTGGDARLALDDALMQAAPRHPGISRTAMSRTDIDVAEVYDPFSITALCLLEDYGLVPSGSAGAMMRDGALAPGGTLPFNTGGGQLSGFYLQGMTPLIEAIIQLRGDGGARQVPNAEVGLVTGLGGRMDHHAVLLLGRST